MGWFPVVACVVMVVGVLTGSGRQEWCVMTKRSGMALVPAMACSLTLVLGGCGGSGDPGQATDQSLDNTIISVYGCEPSRPLIPSDTVDECGGQLVNAMFSRLVRFDSKGRPQNDLADEITHNDRMTRYTVRLVDGRSFSDGSPITSRSFTRAWSWAASAANRQAGARFFSNIKGYGDLQKSDTPKDARLSGLKVIDDLTFTVDLTKPSATFPIQVGMPAFAPLPHSFYKDPRAFGSRPVTSGPYRFAAWHHQKVVKIRRSATYTGNAGARNGGIDFRIYPEAASALADVQAGHLDVITTIPASARTSFVSDPGLQSYNKAGSSLELLTIPAGVEHFGQDREGRLRRQAISMAIDRRSLIEKTLDNLAQQPSDFTTPAIPGWSEDLKGEDHLRYRAEQARTTWSQADAISRWPQDRPLTLVHAAQGGNEAFYKGMARSIQATLGIRVEARSAPATADPQTGPGQAQGGQAAFFSTLVSPDYPSPEAYLNQEFVSSPSGSGDQGTPAYDAPGFRDLLHRAARAQGVDEANRLYQKAEETLLEDLPAIPLYTLNNIGAGSRKVQGLVPGWNGWPSFCDLYKDR